MCRYFYHYWPTCHHMDYAHSMTMLCGNGLLQNEIVRQHLITGLGVLQIDTSNCVDQAHISLGEPPYNCPRCVAPEAITIDAVEARLRDVSGPSIRQPARQAPPLQSVEARLRAVGGPNGSRSVQQELTWQSAEARLRAVSGPSNTQPAPQPPTWQEAQAEIYLREERAFALLDDEYDRIMADLRLMEEQARRIQEAEEASRRLAARTSNRPNQPNRFRFNPQTAEHGSFIQGAGSWTPDRRSRTQRSRDEARQRRNRPSGLTQVAIAEEEEDVVDESNGDNR